MDLHHQHTGKKVRGGNNISDPATLASNSIDLNATPLSPSSTSQAVDAAITMDTLPIVALSHVASFACRGELSGACKSTLEATPELHDKISIADKAPRFSMAEDSSGTLSSQHMGLQPFRALATGRVVAHITVTGCADYKSTKGGYQLLDKTVQRGVQHSIPTLRSITIVGNRGKDSGRVAAIVGVLLPISTKRRRGAPRLTRVELRHGANGITKAGKALAAGLWPGLEQLIVPDCHGNMEHFASLRDALRSGHAPNLRVLNWNKQSIFKEGVADAIMWALEAGKCHHVEQLSFTGNHMAPENRINFLTGALHACPDLRELRLDGTRSPRK